MGVFQNKATGNSINTGIGSQLRVFKDAMGINVSWEWDGTLKIGTIRSIHDKNMVFCTEKGTVAENRPVELVESEGLPAEVWHMQRVSASTPGPFNTISVTVACGADQNYVLAEEKGNLVLQRKSDDNILENHIWQIEGEGGYATVIDNTSYTVPMPDPDFIPQGFDKITNSLIRAPDGTEENLWVWVDPLEKTLGLIFKNIWYTAIINPQQKDKLVATVKDGKIVKMNCIELLPSVSLREKLNLDDCWSRDTVEEVVSLTQRGILTKIENIWLSATLLTADDVVTAAPALSLARVVELEGINFNSDQLGKLEQAFGGDTDQFIMGGGVTIESQSSESLAIICDRAKESILRDVHFEDIDCFISYIRKLLGEEGSKCERLIFDKKTAERYQLVLQDLTKKIGWNVIVEDEKESLMLYKDDKIGERLTEYQQQQREHVNNTWKDMNDSDKIDCLKEQFDVMEKKIDNLTKIVGDSFGLKDALDGKQRQLWNLQDKVQRIESRQFHDRHGH